MPSLLFFQRSPHDMTRLKKLKTSKLFLCLLTVKSVPATSLKTHRIYLQIRGEKALLYRPFLQENSCHNNIFPPWMEISLSQALKSCCPITTLLCFCTLSCVPLQAGGSEWRPSCQRHSERTGGYSAPGTQCPDCCPSPATTITHIPAEPSAPGLRQRSGFHRNHTTAKGNSHLMNPITLFMGSV